MSKVNTKSYEDIINSVCIDNRENKRVEYALEQYSALNPIVEQLPIGDYIFKGDNVEVVFEYKTAEDYLSSITSEDNHLHNQYYDMITNYDYSFIIVEADDLRGTIQQRYYSTGQDVSLSQVNGSIAEYSVNSTVLFAQTQYQAFDMMMRVAGKIIRNKPVRYKYGKKDKNTALNYLSAIKGLDNKALNIVKQLNLHTLNDLLELTVDDLTSVDKIGEATAKKIINQIR